MPYSLGRLRRAAIAASATSASTIPGEKFHSASLSSRPSSVYRRNARNATCASASASTTSHVAAALDSALTVPWRRQQPALAVARARDASAAIGDLELAI